MDGWTINNVAPRHGVDHEKLAAKVKEIKAKLNTSGTNSRDKKYKSLNLF